MPELTLCNAVGRDAQVAAESARIPVRIRRLDKDGRQCRSARILKGTLDRGFQALLNKYAGTGHGEPLADALIGGDPEIDFEAVGMFLRDTKRVYVDRAGHVVHAVTHQEIVRNPDGSEKLRRPHAVLSANVALPLRWSGKLIPRAEAARKFVFTGKRQIRHVNGLTYDFLYAIARELEQRDSLLVVGAGPKGNQPLVLRRGALPYRGFLEGRTRADEYLLLLHLSNLELKTPETTKGTMQHDQVAA
jgi:hypothetical protein